MPASVAQIAANRRNSQLSTGPKTDEGKEKSRRNALKHGLTGEGVALPDEDAAEVADRFQAIESELQPSGVASRLALRRFAYLSVRLERCERAETAHYAKKIRHADDEFRDERLAVVEQLAKRFTHDPLTSNRRLQRFPEGIDFLIDHWSELKNDLMNLERNTWTLNHRSRMEMLLGIPEANYRMSRVQVLSEVMSGFSANIDPSEIAGLNAFEQLDWARRQLAAMIDAEIDRLREQKTLLNPDVIEQDRLEAASRALFDTQTSMQQLRKYEAATERAMYKALNEFRAIEATLKADPPVEVSPPETTEMASFEPEPTEDAESRKPDRKERPTGARNPKTIQFSKRKSAKTGSKSIETTEESPK
jgi:hypothetical protein